MSSDPSGLEGLPKDSTPHRSVSGLYIRHHRVVPSPRRSALARPRPHIRATTRSERRYLPQSSSASRRTASHAGFLLLSQSGERPLRYGESFRFDTIPSSPILQAYSNTVGPSPTSISPFRLPPPAP